MDRIPAYQSLSAEFPGWYPDLGAMLAMLSYQAARLGERDLAEQYRATAARFEGYLWPNQREYDRFMLERNSCDA